MAIPFIMRLNRSQGSVPAAIHLNGVPYVDETETVSAEVYWRFEDDTNMEPQLLGEQNIGYSLVVPFDMKGRAIRVFAKGKTEDGVFARQTIKEVSQVVFGQPEVATLVSLSFSSGGGTPKNVLTIANNNGDGQINIFRKIGSADFAKLTSVAPSTTTYNDNLSINGTYQYYLTQDGLEGQSVTLSIVVTGASAPAGSAPTNLAGTFDGFNTVGMTWTNNSGTGSNLIERKINTGGTWAQIGSVISGSTSFDDTDAAPGNVNRTYFYRVRNASVSGYSNEIIIYIPKA